MENYSYLLAWIFAASAPGEAPRQMTKTFEQQMTRDDCQAYARTYEDQVGFPLRHVPRGAKVHMAGWTCIKVSQRQEGTGAAQFLVHSYVPSGPPREAHQNVQVFASQISPEECSLKAKDAREALPLLIGPLGASGSILLSQWSCHGIAEHRRGARDADGAGLAIEAATKALYANGSGKP